MARKQINFKKNLTRRTSSTNSGMLASNMVKTKKKNSAIKCTGVEKSSRAQPVTSTPERTGVVPPSDVSGLQSSVNPPAAPLKKKKLTKNERQERLRAALIINSTQSSSDDDKVTNSNNAAVKGSTNTGLKSKYENVHGILYIKGLLYK